MDPLEAAHRVVAEHFPSAVAAFLGGGVLGPRRTPTSDLDVVVVLAGRPAPYRETLRAHGWIVEVFAHTRSSLRHYWDRDERARRPTLARMCADGRVLTSVAGEAASVRAEARRRLAAGPPPLEREELDRRRYTLCDQLDDLVGGDDPDEMAQVAAGVLTAAGELALCVAGRWLGSGKWLQRELAAWDGALASRLVAAHRTAVATGDPTDLVRVAEDVLESAGGRLMEGYRADGEGSTSDGEGPAADGEDRASEEGGSRARGRTGRERVSGNTELTVLGCSGGYPEPGHPCSGYLVEAGGTRVLLDAGPGTLERLLGRVDPWELDAIWISHLHPDHWTDLPIALHRMAVTAPGWDRRPPTVLAPEGWEEVTGVAAQRYPPDRTPYVARTLGDGDTFVVGDLRLHSRAVEHGMPAFGLRVESASGVLAYSGDTAPCPALDELARGADLLLCEATLAPGRTTPISMNAEQAATVASDAGVGRLLLTHLLPDVDPGAAVVAAAAVFPGLVEAARPGRRLTIEAEAPAGVGSRRRLDGARRRRQSRQP